MNFSLHSFDVSCVDLSTVNRFIWNCFIWVLDVTYTDPLQLMNNN